MKFSIRVLILASLAFCLLGSPLFGQTRKTRRVTIKRSPIVRTVKLPPAAPKKIVKEPKTIGVSIERYVNSTEINGDGTATQTVEMLQRLTSAAAVEAFGKFERIFNGDLERAEVLEAYTLKADGAKIPVPAAAIQIKLTAQAEAAPSFSSLKVISIFFENVDEGDATFFKLRRQTIKPTFAKHFDDVEIFSQLFEWKSIELNYSAPADYPLYVQAVDLEGGRLADENGKARWQWRKQNLPPLEIETAMYDFYGKGPKLAVTSFKNFEELGAAYWAEAASRSRVTEEIQKLADEITKNIKEPAQQASAIYEWTNKNIRYLSIVLERGGWIPHDARQILTNRYGDCKDYTTLLHSLLKAKNIESHPVIIRADMTEWFPEVAAPSFFNHAILYIPSIDQFADATAPNTRLGLIPQQIVGKRAFLAGAKNGVIKVPDGRPEDNQLLSDIEINFSPDGSLKARSKNTYQGRTEIYFRPMFSDSAFKRNSADFVKFLLAFYGVDGTGRVVKIGNPFKVGEPFDIELEVEQKNYTNFAKRGSLRLPVAVNMTNMIQLEAFVKEEKRQTNLLLGATHVRENFVINLPAGASVSSVPAAINFSNQLGSFRNEFKSAGGKIEVVRELFINRDIIAAAEYAQIRELINKVVESYNGEIKYSSSAPVSGGNGKPPKKIVPSNDLHTLSKNIYEEANRAANEKPLTVRQIAHFEIKLKQNPDDVETRRRIVRHYNDYRTKPTTANKAALIKHRVWFIQNQPEMNDFEIARTISWIRSADEPEYKILKAEWLKQVAANESNWQVILNAAEFLRHHESTVAEKLLLEAGKTHAENYEIPLLLYHIYGNEAAESKNKDKPDEIKALRTKAFEMGETALSLLKLERSDERDEKRRALLKTLSRAALEIENYTRAKRLALELVLDFGQSTAESSFEEAAHHGNIVLGLAALGENDTAKAKDYLLIAIRAPLRDELSHLWEIDTELAKKLYHKGEKTVVAEYLKLAQSLWNLQNYGDLYEDELKNLKLWQEQIKKGVTPSFDFENP